MYYVIATRCVDRLKYCVHIYKYADRATDNQYVSLQRTTLLGYLKQLF